MNREYAFNREKEKCVACKEFVYTGTAKCHHKRRKLPLKEINKLNNLTTLCNKCHGLVHSSETIENKKILELRRILEEENLNVIK